MSADNVKRSIHIGCQSWGYEDWITPVGGPYVFYPPGMKKSEMLPFYSKVFGTVEVDATVYGIPAATTLEKWYDETPANFIFSLKTPREITHEGRLSTQTLPVMREFVTRAAILEEKLGVILIQLPPHFDASRDNGQNLREFLAELPRGFKYAVEFRHPDWFIDWTFQEPEQNRVTLALVEGPWVSHDLMFDAAKKIKTPFAYIRIMSGRDLQKFDRIYRHRDDELRQWSDLIGNLTGEIYIYVDNYFEGFAPGTINKLQHLFELPVSRPEDFQEQRSLFD